MIGLPAKPPELLGSVMKALSIGLALAVGLTMVTGATASAQARGHSGSARGPVVGHAAPRGSAPSGVYGGGRVIASPRFVGSAPYYPYYYGYRPGFRVGLYLGYGYPYYGYGYPYYGYPYYGYPGYYGAYGYAPYGYAPPAGDVNAQQGTAYGGVRIQGAPRDAQIFADGYYVGIVDDFDGPTQHLNLEAGVHAIEIRVGNQPPIKFDINVQAGQTITYHAGLTR
jgi:hypothetical protein